MKNVVDNFWAEKLVEVNNCSPNVYYWREQRKAGAAYETEDVVEYAGVLYVCVQGGFSKESSSDYEIFQPSSSIDYYRDGTILWKVLSIGDVPARKVGTSYIRNEVVRIQQGARLFLVSAKDAGTVFADRLEIGAAPAMGEEIRDGLMRWVVIKEVTNNEVNNEAEEKAMETVEATVKAIETGVKQGTAATASAELRALIRKSVGDGYPTVLAENQIGQAVEAFLLPILIKTLASALQAKSPGVAQKAITVCDLAITQAAAEHSQILFRELMPFLTQVADICPS